MRSFHQQTFSGPALLLIALHLLQSFPVRSCRSRFLRDSGTCSDFDTPFENISSCLICINEIVNLDAGTSIFGFFVRRISGHGCLPRLDIAFHCQSSKRDTGEHAPHISFRLISDQESTICGVPNINALISNWACLNKAAAGILALFCACCLFACLLVAGAAALLQTRHSHRLYPCSPT